MAPLGIGDWSFNTFLMCFAGGILGTTLGGLYAFILCALTVLLGCVSVLCGGSDFLLLNVGLGPIFGPHVGVVWGKQHLLEKLTAYKVRPAKSDPPHKFETGTLNHEGLAGVIAAIDYLAEIGRQYGDLETIGLAKLLEAEGYAFTPPPGYAD